MLPVKIQGLTKRFGAVAALDGINLDVKAGEIFFLLGPSGCGKTTLLRSIAGFCIPEEGRIFFGDVDVTSEPPNRRHAGMVFQSYALWPHKSVAGNVSFGLEEQGLPKLEIRRRVTEALASVRMAGLEGRLINQLSGGQQQRVALARALVVRPRCLLLDEPLSNLDAKLRMEMRLEIKRICREFGLTSVYVTHDQKEALSIADRLAIMDRGRICQVGTPEEVYRSPINRFVADFIGESNFVPGTVTLLQGGIVSVATAAGEILGRVPVGAQMPGHGNRVVLSIRPECLRIQNKAAELNCFTGDISESIYLGEVAEHRFTSGALSFKIFELNPRFPRHREDACTNVGVSPDDVLVLPE